MISSDSDSSNFSWVKDEDGNNTKERNPEFPQNYINHIKFLMGDKFVVLVSSHDVVRNALKKNGIEYYMVYPDKSLKEEWIQRFKDRGNNEEFVNFISNNWDKFIDDIENDNFSKKIKLNSGEYLMDRYYDIYKK